MVDQDLRIKEITELRSALEPTIATPIWQTIMSSAPVLGPLFQYLLLKEVRFPILSIVLGVIGLIWTIYTWYWYISGVSNFRMAWEEILHSMKEDTFKYDIKEVKDRNVYYLSILSIIAGISLVLFYLTLATYLLTGIAFFRPFVIISILLFLFLLFLSAVSVLLQLIYVFLKENQKCWLS